MRCGVSDGAAAASRGATPGTKKDWLGRIATVVQLVSLDSVLAYDAAAKPIAALDAHYTADDWEVELAMAGSPSTPEIDLQSPHRLCGAIAPRAPFFADRLRPPAPTQ
jgi:hypothetical protein